MSATRQPDRTVVLIGRTGSGKSSLANALCGRDLFGASNQSVSKTKVVESQTVDLTWKKDPAHPTFKVKIVDTIGIGDTELSMEEVLHRLANACYECKDGLNAVYFVTGGRVTKEEVDAFEILWQVLFGADILEYTTVVRSQFYEFQSATAVQKDQAALKEQKGPTRQIFELIASPFLYVDVPPAQYGMKESREKSGALLLDHLVVKCKKRFCPPVLDEVKEQISKHLEAERAVKKQLKSLKESLEKMKNALNASAEEKTALQKQIQQKKGQLQKAKANVASGMGVVVKRKGGRCSIL